MLKLFLAINPLNAASLDDVNAAIKTYNRLGAYNLDTLTKSELDALVEGKIPHQIKSEKDNSKTAIGCMLTQASLESLWIATQDTHFILESRVRSTLVEDRGHGDLIWYSYLDLPWPLKNRHWANDTRNNRRLAVATENQIWETHWQLHPETEKLARPIIEDGAIDGLTLSQFNSAIVVEESIGGWIGIRLGNRSLYCMYAAFRPGGVIPDKLVANSFNKKMPKMMRDVNDKALNNVEGD